jgi:hypothetical protein
MLLNIHVIQFTFTDDDEVVVKAKPTVSKTNVAEADDNAQPMKPWSAEEQKLLEQALRTYPSSHSDRWDRISDCIPGRNKKECMARFKVRVDLFSSKQ